MNEINVCMCQNDDCNKPYVVGESIDFLKAIDLSDELRDWAQDRVIKYCVDCCMEMMTAIHDIYFKKELQVEVTEHITALTREEYIAHLKEKNTDEK